MVRDVPDVCVPRRTTLGTHRRAGAAVVVRASAAGDRPRRQLRVVAGIALFALAATALVVVLVPALRRDAVGFRRSSSCSSVSHSSCWPCCSAVGAPAAVMRPLEVLDVALAAVTGGDFTVHVELERAAAEIQSVGESVNAIVRELSGCGSSRSNGPRTSASGGSSPRWSTRRSTSTTSCNGPSRSSGARSTSTVSTSGCAERNGGGDGDQVGSRPSGAARTIVASVSRAADDSDPLIAPDRRDGRPPRGRDRRRDRRARGSMSNSAGHSSVRRARRR